MNQESLDEEELNLFNLLNQERQRYGFRELQLHPGLVKAALLKAGDMVENNYFAHYSPTYGSPGNLARAQNVNGFDCIGSENLAQAPNALLAHRSLTASSVHLAGMLDPRLTHVGIGSAAGGNYAKVCVQLFAGEHRLATVSDFKIMAAIVSSAAKVKVKK